MREIARTMALEGIMSEKLRTTLAKSDRTDRETFYYLTMTADLVHVKHMGVEMTQEEVRIDARKRGVQEDEIERATENARMMKWKTGTATPSSELRILGSY
jgi:hypothetical protein